MVNQSICAPTFMISDCSTDHTCFGHAEILKYIITNVITCLLEICATWRQTGKKLGAQIDITNTLSMPMVKIFSQLLLYYIMGDRYLSLSAIESSSLHPLLCSPSQNPIGHPMMDES